MGDKVNITQEYRLDIANAMQNDNRLSHNPLPPTSNRLKILIFISIILNWLHLLEIVITKYYLDSSAFTYKLADFLGTKYEATYYSFHVTLYVLLTLFLIVVIQPKSLKYILALYSWILISETHHFLTAILDAHYLPGSITSLLYAFLTFAYIKTLLKEWKNL